MKIRERTDPKIIKFFILDSFVHDFFFLLLNVKMSTIVGILKFISMINTTSKGLKAWEILIFFIVLYLLLLQSW